MGQFCSLLNLSVGYMCHGGLVPPCGGEMRQARDSTAGQARRGTTERFFQAFESRISET